MGFMRFYTRFAEETRKQEVANCENAVESKRTKVPHNGALKILFSLEVYEPHTRRKYQVWLQNPSKQTPGISLAQMLEMLTSTMNRNSGELM